MKELRKLMVLFVLVAAPWDAARAVEYQLHGFASQAYLISEGNNFYGDSTNGSHDYYEAGASGTVNLGYGLLASAQGLIRDAGLSDTGKPRLDFALIDWNVLQGAQTSGGIRLGRVKNSMGLYNDTRDVIFARPSILLPQSIYYDGIGLRGIFFSSDGGQAYLTHVTGQHELTLTVSAALDRDFTKKERLVLTAGGATPDEIRLKDLTFAQLADSWNGGRVKVGLSHVRAQLAVDPDPGFPIDATLRANLYGLSLQYNAERYSLTSEYFYTRSKTRSSVLGDTASSSDGGYVQAEYRLTPQWTALARYDATFRDADDRDGSQAATGVDRHSLFAHDFTVGGSWRPDAHWGVWAELHQINGTATAPALDNPGGANDPHWTLFTVMAGYRF